MAREDLGPRAGGGTEVNNPWRVLGGGVGEGEEVELLVELEELVG